MSVANNTTLLDIPPQDWGAKIEQFGGKKYQGKIATRWVFQRGILDWRNMTDLPAGLRDTLHQELPLLTAKLETQSKANDDGAVKLLLRLADGASVEAVSMPGTKGRTICLSTQVGCPVRCTFCASGADGLERNLTRGEIVEQWLWLRAECGDFGRVVIMGMGDAGHNLKATLGALDTLLDERGANFSSRRVTVSTVGPKGALAQLAAWERPVSLALSVHAPDDDLRRTLVPGDAKRTLEETLQEADGLFAAHGREYTIEYVLLRGVNDHTEQARDLAKQLRGRRCHVNLIPYNPVEGLGYDRPEQKTSERFADTMRNLGCTVTLRHSLGRSADAACGQLRRRQLPC
ncbi:MAG: 23S rRNA (adenine(2503)-C(2))-methyltransferase RlmN [Planctomycetes bacterium]|nr:23S rRNA (adenine(2503)-C(2))-methyltransferase RlmN [Planctomycetota bacterium]